MRRSMQGPDDGAVIALTGGVCGGISVRNCVDDPDELREVGGEIPKGGLSLGGGTEGADGAREGPIQGVSSASVLIELYLGNVALE